MFILGHKKVDLLRVFITVSGESGLLKTKKMSKGFTIKALGIFVFRNVLRIFCNPCRK